MIDQRGRTTSGKMLPDVRFGDFDQKCVLTEVRDVFVKMKRISDDAGTERLGATTLDSAMSF